MYSSFTLIAHRHAIDAGHGSLLCKKLSRPCSHASWPQADRQFCRHLLFSLRCQTCAAATCTGRLSTDSLLLSLSPPLSCTLSLRMWSENTVSGEASRSVRGLASTLCAWCRGGLTGTAAAAAGTLGFGGGTGFGGGRECCSAGLDALVAACGLLSCFCLRLPHEWYTLEAEGMAEDAWAVA